MNVVKYGHTLTVSNEALAESRESAAAINRWMDATPEERAQWAAEADRQRAGERAAATPVPLTVDALTEKMGWSREFAEHLVQPYCDCSDGRDGWDYCQHARDLGLIP